MFAHRIESGKKVNLESINTKQDGGMTKEEGLAKLEKLGTRLGELQELLFAAGTHGILIVFQGMDTAGKDGAINRLLGFVNVQSARVSSFKVPTPKELSHDFLWRVHSETPGKGGVGIFNRSHYEDVLVVRVHQYVQDSVWKARYDHINAFEKLLVDSNILVVKFFLHISKEEQEQRLLDREKEVEKAWKLSAGDWKERQFWEDYQAAYQDALTKCSPDHAPWYVVPADRKWYRDLCIAEALVETLEPLADDWIDRLKAVGEKAKTELSEFRATQKKGV
jgi:PPK2 family polyphosphate:nucleotide phosphotransferase